MSDSKPAHDIVARRIALVGVVVALVSSAGTGWNAYSNFRAQRMREAETAVSISVTFGVQGKVQDNKYVEGQVLAHVYNCGCPVTIESIGLDRAPVDLHGTVQWTRPIPAWKSTRRLERFDHLAVPLDDLTLEYANEHRPALLAIELGTGKTQWMPIPQWVLDQRGTLAKPKSSPGSADDSG